MKLNRRQFLQGLAAGLAVAAAPPAIRAAVVEEAKQHTEELPWGFVVRGGGSGMFGGDQLIMIPPGVHWTNDGPAKIFTWPEPFDLDKLLAEEEFNRQIELWPWAPYRPQMEALIPEDLKWASRNYRRRR